MKASLLLVMVAVLSSCTTVKYIPVDLTKHLPPRLENLTEQELDKQLGECVSDATYIDIIETYRRKDTLRGIIESTHAK